ncbi:MAG: hypothetical protein IMHGJWDQ_001571 [Candidatus Fervidibacter sp.]
MLVKDAQTVEAQPVAEAEGVRVRWLIGEKEGATNFHMRLFELSPGAATPWHQHPWEHEVFVLEGEGVVRSEQGEHPLKGGTVVFVPPNEWHQFRNTHPEKPLKFLCLIPAVGVCALPQGNACENR